MVVSVGRKDSKDNYSVWSSSSICDTGAKSAIYYRLVISNMCAYTHTLGGTAQRKQLTITLMVMERCIEINKCDNLKHSDNDEVLKIAGKPVQESRSLPDMRQLQCPRRDQKLPASHCNDKTSHIATSTTKYPSTEKKLANSNITDNISNFCLLK